MSRLTTAAVFGLTLVFSSSSAQTVPPLSSEEWKLEVIHRTKGRSPVKGLIDEETPTHVRITCVVFRKAGSPTVVLPDIVPRSEIASIDRLGERDRAALKGRLDTLRRERTVLVAQTQLWKGGKVELPPHERLELKPAPWGKDDKDKGLLYESTYFRLLSNARADVVHLTAVQLEQVFAAYSRLLPPRGAPRPTTILLTRSVAEYQELVKQRRLNILNPAFFDPRENQVVCGCDLERLTQELSRVREHHEQLKKDLQTRRKELFRIYNNQVPPEILRPVDGALARIAGLEAANGKVVKGYHSRLVQCLCHEALHAYLNATVFADRKVRVPAWLDEGLAQVFETALVEGGELQVGTPDRVRLKRVQSALTDNQLAPIADLLASTARQFQVAHTQDRQLSDRYYLTAWALAFWLTFDQKALESEKLDEFLKALEREIDPREAFGKMVGLPLAEAEKKWRLYLENLRADGTSSARR